MTPRRILVTGAAGFVGRHMLRACRDAFPGAALIAASRAEDLPAEGLGAETLPFDLLDPAGIASVVETAAPDVCIHLAARADVAGSFQDPDGVWRANVDGTLALASAILHHAPACALLHAGSAEIYGLSFAAGTPLDESAPLRPANPYAAAKAAADIALGEMALRGLRVIRMRPLNHVGAGQSPRFALAAFARQIARAERGEQEPVIETGNLQAIRDFLDVRDVCAAYVAAILRFESLPRGAAFNLASETPRRLGDVLGDMLALSPLTLTLATRDAALRPTDIPVTRCSASAARAALDWIPGVPWADTLADILAFWRGALPAEF